MKILAKKLFLALAVVSALCACSDDDDGGGSPPTTTGAGAPKEAESGAQPAIGSPTQSTAPEGLPSPADEQSVAEIESQLRPISALDTFGGQLLAAYLQKSITDVEAAAQVLDDPDYVMSNLAEMSMAINQLKAEGRYTSDNQRDVQTLEGAITQLLNKKIAEHKRYEDLIEYGAAIGLGVIGGVYSDRVIEGLRKLGNSPVIQWPKNKVRDVYVATKGKSQELGAWLSRQSSKVRESDPVARTVEKSNDLFRRTAAYIASNGGKVTPKTQVQRHIVRLFGSDELAKGFRVVEVPPGPELAGVKRMVFHKTGITGFRIHQRKGEDFFVAKQLGPDNEWHYFYVRGSGVSTITRRGEEQVISAEGVAALGAARARSFGERTVTFVTDTGKKIKTGVTSSRAYQYATTNPQARRAIQATAVGGTIGAITLLALRPLDTRYLTLDDYVKDLEREGIDIEDFLDVQRATAQKRAGTDETVQLVQ